MNKQKRLSQSYRLKPDDFSERRLHRVSGWLALYLVLQSELGVAWDRQWHDSIGITQFWIPPHILLYTGIGCAGLIALVVVLVDTVRYFMRKPRVYESTNICVFKLFHAPIGFFILGLGTLIDLLAAPLDSYWHILYGVDVSLWSPFHLMGFMGGIVAEVGIYCIFAFEAIFERHRKKSSLWHFLWLNPFEWGVLIILSASIELTLPGLTAFLPLSLGSWHLLTYPFPLALAGSVCLVGGVKFTHKPGTATLISVILWFLAFGTQVFVPWAMRFTADNLGLAFRLTRHEPVFNITLALLPLLFLLSALILDGLVFYRQRLYRKTMNSSILGVCLLGCFIASSCTLMPPCIIQIVRYFTSSQIQLADFSFFAPRWLDSILTLPLVIVVGMAAALLGVIMGGVSPKDITANEGTSQTY